MTAVMEDAFVMGNALDQQFAFENLASLFGMIHTVLDLIQITTTSTHFVFPLWIRLGAWRKHGQLR